MQKRQVNEERLKRLKTFSNISKSQHLIAIKNPNQLRRVKKAESQQKLTSMQKINKRIKIKHQRSITSSQGTNGKLVQKRQSKYVNQSPYEKFIKQLNIILPTPKQKFYQFMEIAPFNRISHHIQLIQHFLKQYKFFNHHPLQILQQIAKKIRICSYNQIQDKMIAVIQYGQCLYKNQCLKKGDVVGRKPFLLSQISPSPQCKFIVLNRHQYNFLVSCYLQKEKQIFRNFLSSIQIFKMFSKKAFDKFMQSLTLNFFCEGQYLYRFGQEATSLFIVYEGIGVRRVIVEIDKTNKIPLLKYSKIVKILSKSYEHKIQFEKQDLIGIAQVIDHIETRKQNIRLQKSSIVLGLDKNIVQQNLDQYIIDRLRKYNLKKYPVTYDKLCEKYEKEKISIKESQKRKISALRSTIDNQISSKRVEKINSIIKKYEQNIKKSQFMNLIECKIQERRVQRQ